MTVSGTGDDADAAPSVLSARLRGNPGHVDGGRLDELRRRLRLAYDGLGAD